MNFNIAKMVCWMARMTVRNGISGMTQMTGMTRITGMNWMARMTGMTVMNGITVVTRMGKIMQMQSPFVSLKQFVNQDSSLLV